MTAPSPIEALTKIPAFSKCSEASLQLIQKEGRLARFDIGHALSTRSIIPDRVLIILEGRARLLGQNNGKLASLGNLSPGAFVGIASLLRAEACEEVSAANPLVAWSLPDTLIADIYKTDTGFRTWCDTTIFPAEVCSLLEALISKSEKASYGIGDILADTLSRVEVHQGDDIEKQISDKDKLVFLGSNNCSEELNTIIENTDILGEARGVFGIRLITLPTDHIKKIQKGKIFNPKESSEIKNSEIEPEINEDAIPKRTSLDLDGKNPREEVLLIRGDGPIEESLACFKMLAQIMNLPYRKDVIEKSVREAINRGKMPNLPMIGQIASGMGLLASGATVESSMVTRLNVPCIIEWSNSFGIIVQSNSKGILLAHPNLGWLELSPEDIEESYPDGVGLVLVNRTSSTPNSKFDFTWFYPAIKKYRSTLLLVLTASFVVQLFTLANPLLIQIIIDKVISQRSLDTLQVLGIALIAVTFFEGILSSLRTFLFTDTTNRIDMRLGAEVIDHLLRLPIGYFDRRPVGELGTRIAELEKIRNFLTGEALTTIVDACFSIIYIFVMSLYSWILTLVALTVVPIQVAITLAGAPIFRRQFRKSAEENASTQSHLTEVLTGIQTVKAQNVEMVSRWKWQERYSKYIARSFEKTITGTALGQTGQILQKLSQLMVLWVGASLVLKGELTLGQLIAFRIISGYVTQPLLRLSTIWQRIQELRVSFERLADIVDTSEESTEADQKKIPLPPINGDVSFNNVDFSFKSQSPLVLKNVNLKIKAGTFVGVVGQSGSGKSTLMKLISRLYSPNSGKICIDNYDIDKVELYSLRRQVGIVPQEPLLFSGNVSENISLTDPNASSDDIKIAAQTACAHEFIMDLPSGYSTELGERGANLSGGQRQRLAIARTLLANPKLLVMDEATSALDYDTERRVCQNLRDSLKECTVFFVTHRLSTVKHADVIVMMHQGALVEAGSHDDLINLKGRYYALYRQQEAG